MDQVDTRLKPCKKIGGCQIEAKHNGCKEIGGCQIEMKCNGSSGCRLKQSTMDARPWETLIGQLGDS